MNQANKEFEELVKENNKELISRLVELKLTKELWRLIDLLISTTEHTPIGYDNLDDFMNKILRDELNALLSMIYKVPPLKETIFYIIHTLDKNFNEIIDSLKEDKM